ncbi:hypothetical protein QYE76_001474 [Lolium multiflorum]|uniref:RRM domain-containing protein n=1 Tax=Lolium multiflorum TaxID=4521 RepID=A0AAD8RLF1_LOLMU|nr:hypothetical protein QYE76_001474 [Lolium multiflorum]
MPPARRPRRAPVAPAASESSPAAPPAVGEAPPDTAEAAARVTEVGGGAVESRAEEATGAESVEEPEVEEEPEEAEEDPEEEVEEDPEEEVEEDPEEAEEDPEDEADGGKGNEEETVLATGQGDGPAAATESERTVAMEGGDEEKSMVKDGGGEDAGLESAVVEEPAKEDEGQEHPEEENLEDDAMEEDAAEVSGEGATVDEKNELPEEHGESGDEGSHRDTDKDVVACQFGAQNGELDPSFAMLGSVSVGNVKDLEIFVGRLPKGCTEEDITVVFSQFGEIVSTIIVPAAKKKNNRNAFVRYMSTEAAQKALTEFKDGVEVTGEKVKVSASRVKNTLYLKNICKSWTKEQVLLSLKSIGIEEFEMTLPDDPDTGGRNRGISFLKFAAPDSTESALRKLQQPDALVDIDRSEKEYARTPTESCQELALKVKSVYLEHVPLSWNEGNIEECCKSYGEIQEVRLLKKSKKKIAFVEFSFRKSALACVEGINSAKIGGEVKLVASLARPRREIHLNKKGAKGGFKVSSGATSEDANNSIKKKDHKKEVMVKKSSHKLPKGDTSKLTSQVDAEVPQASNLYKGKRKAGKTENIAVNERLLKKARKNRDVLTKPSNRARHGGYARAAYAGESSGNMKRSLGPRYVTNDSHPIAGASSRSKPNSRDLEPHAGYIPPVNRVRAPADHVQVTYVYDQPRATPSNYHHIDGLPYTREIAAPPPAYYGYTSNPQYQGEYAYTYLPPPHLSGADYPRSGEYIPRRRYY